MSTYRESEIDKKNRQWFANDKSCNTLRKIAIEQSSIRGLGVFEMAFNYPITVIVGENGSGKSTVLSLVSCAFHNNTPFCPMSLLANSKKQRRHYTYSDFFAFTAAERGIMADIKITSTILSDKKAGDTRSKSFKGKWKDYDTRPKRAVSFLGINRILPPSESQTYRNYSGSFGANKLTTAESQALAGYMNQIFGRDYTSITQSSHHKYRLYGCTRTAGSYTGFNMGAGENAVLQLLYEILSAGKGALIVVDEMELGLHVQAQRKLMAILKGLCLSMHTQIICSSHSATILSSVPNDARVMVKARPGTIDVVYGISAEMATSELSGVITAEKDILVEDDVAKAFIEAVLPCDVRRRVEVKVIGSADSSMLYAMEIHFREGRNDFLAVMDGDKRNDKQQKIKTVVDSLTDCKAVTSIDVEDYLKKSISFLPGNEWPEKVIVEGLICSRDLTRILADCKVGDIAEMKRYLQTALAAGKHNEFYSLANSLHLDEATVRLSAIRQYEENYKTEVQQVIDFISSSLVPVILDNQYSACGSAAVAVCILKK